MAVTFCLPGNLAHGFEKGVKFSQRRVLNTAIGLIEQKTYPALGLKIKEEQWS